jgi:hypothetical protein
MAELQGQPGELHMTLSTVKESLTVVDDDDALALIMILAELD